MVGEGLSFRSSSLILDSSFSTASVFNFSFSSSCWIASFSSNRRALSSRVFSFSSIERSWNSSSAFFFWRSSISCHRVILVAPCFCFRVLEDN